MANTDLYLLYKLHLVDAALYEIKQHAAALDVGKAEAAKIKELEADPEGTVHHSRALGTELKDLELQSRGLEDKLKKLDGELYGGKIVNPREVANLEADIASVKEHRAKIDERILELWELLPPAQEASAAIEGEITKLKEAIAKKHGEAKREHERLQAEFKTKAAERAPAAKLVPPQLLQQYERIREKMAVGMALVSPDHRCAVCGMHVPEKALAAIADDKVTQCENCRRILFQVVPG